jgi:hypothetical protein
MPTEPKSDYPEHDKMLRIADKSQAIGDFIEWLSTEKHVQLMTWVDMDEEVPCSGTIFRECIDGFASDSLDDQKATSVPCQHCHGKGTMNQHFEGWLPQPATIQSLLAQHFDIDEKAIEREKRAMLERMREVQP